MTNQTGIRPKGASTDDLHTPTSQQKPFVPKEEIAEEYVKPVKNIVKEEVKPVPATTTTSIKGPRK